MHKCASHSNWWTAVLLLTLPSFGVAQGKGEAAHDIFFRRFFVSYGAARLYDIRLSHAPPGPVGEPENLSGSGRAFGAGISVLGASDRFLFQMAYSRSAANFSDWRVADRTVAFHSFDFTFGYVFRSPVPVVPYLNLVAGWYHQSDFTESDAFDTNLGSYEAMERSAELLGVGLGAKVGLLKYFALDAEARLYKEGDYYCGPNCYYINAPPVPKYWHTTVSLQVYFGHLWHASAN